MKLNKRCINALLYFNDKSFNNTLSPKLQYMLLVPTPKTLANSIVSDALQEVPDLATALKCLLPALGGTYRSVHPLSLFFFLFSPPDGVGDGISFPSLAGTFTLVETVTAATPFSFFPKPQQLTERVRTLATGCCTLQTPVANCHLQFPESFASLAPPSPF